MTIRKGTIAVFLQNALRWSDPATPNDERHLLEKAIEDAMPALKAVGLFAVLEARYPKLRAFLVGR